MSQRTLIEVDHDCTRDPTEVGALIECICLNPARVSDIDVRWALARNGLKILATRRHSDPYHFNDQRSTDGLVWMEWDPDIKRVWVSKKAHNPHTTVEGD